MRINIKRPKNLEDKRKLDAIIDMFKDNIIDSNLSQYVTYKSDSKDICKNGCDFVKDSSDNNSGSEYCKKCLNVRY